MSRRALVRIDLSALRDNLEQVRRIAPGCRVMAVIKANAYGHGLLEAAAALGAADGFAVACLEEALALRRAGVAHPITVLQGFLDGDELRACARYHLWPVIHHRSQVERLQRLPALPPLQVWLKLSTGMNRLGFPAAEARRWLEALQRLPAVETVRLMTHMACADDGPAAEPDRTAAQLARFERAAGDFRGEVSLANSATLIGWPAARRGWLRPGLMLYGVDPFLPGRAPDALPPLRPAMRLTAPLIAVNELAAGEAIGYGATWRCPEAMPVGVVACGYGDGYPRGVGSGAAVVLRGRRAPIVGRVSMDLITIDLRGIDAAVGDEVELWGPAMPVAEVAAAAGTIPYELLCAVAGRVRVEYAGR